MLMKFNGFTKGELNKQTLLIKKQKQPPEVFYKKAVLINFAILAGVCWSVFLLRLQAFKSATLLKKTTTQVLSCEYCKVFKKPILKRICEQLLFKKE